MAIYAIGDVQGCYDSLRTLLDKVRFDPAADTLWFTGDLVNRGPQSLEVLRFVRALPHSITVLGNHDLHCLAVAAGAAPAKKRDTFASLFAAPDRDDLLDWLRQRPLLHVDSAHNCALVHAGLLPEWDITTARRLAREAEQLIRHSDRNQLFQHMYGDEPDHWDESLAGWARVRIIINAFTRLRYCHPDGRLDLRPKMRPGDQPPGLVPWFELPQRRSADTRVIFGHWSTLGYLQTANIIALDSGCLWGGRLTAWPVDAPGEPVQVPCPGLLNP
jgi:bis(5'-nucleosyl)-tetraphosphatase (symmetrical)